MFVLKNWRRIWSRIFGKGSFHFSIKKFLTWSTNQLKSSRETYREGSLKCCCWLLNADLAFSFLYRLLQPVLDGITSSDGDVEESIARLLREFEAINAQQDAIEDQDVLDDLLDDIEEGDEVEEARRDLADDLG